MKRIKTISGLTFISILTASNFIYGNGMKISDSEKKTEISKAVTYNVVDSLRYKPQLDSEYSSTNNINFVNYTATRSSSVNKECEVKITERSKEVFQQILKHHDPHFIQFRIRINFSEKLNATKDVFQPGRWFWTYKTLSGTYQFLSWNLIYGLVTFGLLDYKTLLVPFVNLEISGHCNLTVGTHNTSELITKALVPIVSFTSAQNLPHKYKENFFCYLSIQEDLRNTASYYASVYLLYPIIYINYKCCLLKYNFTNQTFSDDCSQNISQQIKWTNIIFFNIILGCLITAYCPIILFRMFAWLGVSDKTDSGEHDAEMEGVVEVLEEEDWIFADGKSPLTFFDVISFKGIGIDKRWPVFVSRLRRFICLLLAPFVIYIELLVYNRGIGVWKQGDRITVKDFVDVGTPYGFRSFLGDESNRNKVFVPAFGGPVGISALYFVLGCFYIVLPKCLKQIIEHGLPNSDVLPEKLFSNRDKTEQRSLNPSVIKSPLFFGAKDIIKLSQIKVGSADLKPGYSKGLTLMRCNFYLLFTKQFWCQVWKIQTRRVKCITEHTSFIMCLLSVFYVPVYVVCSMLEVLLCLVYYGVPFVFFITVMIRGAIKIIPYLREKNRFFSHLLSFCLVRGLGVVLLFSTIVLFTYCVLLLVFESFIFISHIITYCFVAVIIYPSASFGTLFLLVVILYYIIRQLKYFSYNYTELLSTAVDISIRISMTPNHVTCFKRHLIVSNVGLQNVTGIEVNGRLLDASPDFILNTNSAKILEMKIKDNCFGIPTDLFNSLIQKYRPVHIQVLSLLLRVSILIFCVLLFLSVTYSYIIVHEDQISEVMHVVFVIAVGALPKLIETDFISNNNVPIEKIEKKYVEQFIVAYWTQRRTDQQIRGRDQVFCD